MKKNINYIKLSINNRKNDFSTKKVAELILKELGRRSATGNEIDIYCYSLLPKELLIIFSLSDKYNKSLNNWIASFKRYITIIMNSLFKVKIIWNKGFLYELIDDEISFNNKMLFVLDSPLYKGLVNEPIDFQYSRFIKKPDEL